MPSSAPKRPTLLEIPKVADLDQLQGILNDRFRDLNNLFADYVFQPADANVDIGTWRIVNLADPKDDLDGVNLRTLRKFGGTTTQTSVATGSGSRLRVVCLDWAGQSQDNNRSPTYDVFDDLTVIAVSLSSWDAPNVGDCVINPQLRKPDGSVVNLLASPLTLPLNGTDIVYATNLAVSALSKGMRIANLIVTGGGAKDISTEVIVRA